MKIVLALILLVGGIIFVGSVLLMSPKGGLGMGISGGGGVNEYGSKKSIEFVLKRSAVVSGILFVVASILYPYM